MAQVVLFLLALSLLPLGSRAQSDKRFALLIGNQAYNAKVGPLTNPHNDVALIAGALGKLGFAITVVKDADYRTADAAFKRHIAAVRREGQGAISFVYYSGHGAADPDTKINYMIPIDVANADDEELWTYSINLNTIIEYLRAQAPGATHYIVFDACRNELNLSRKGKKALADKGFVPIGYTPGVMVAFATAPGATASDAGSGGGSYAKALSEEIVRPGVDSMLVFTRVARRLQREIGQDPYLSASTMPEVYFAGDPTEAATVPLTELQAREAERVWASIKDSKDAEDFEAFRRQYGAAHPFYDGRAERRINELKMQRTAAKAEAEEIEAKRKAEQSKRQHADLYAQAERAWIAVRETTDQAVLETFNRQFTDTVYGAMARARLQELKKARITINTPPPLYTQLTPVAPAMVPSDPANRFGAIAYSRTKGAQGWAYDYASQGAAESVALINCHKQAGDCSVPISFRDACGALAIGSTGYGTGTGVDGRTADGYALKVCGQRSRNCRVERRVCTTPHS